MTRFSLAFGQLNLVFTHGISRELFDTDIQQRKFMDNMKLLNKEQSDIFDKVTENVNL